MSKLEEVIEALAGRLGPGAVVSDPSEVLVYECDGFTIEKNSPDVVVFPRNTDDVVEVVKICNAVGVPFLPRGAGTSLAGGCLPIGGVRKLRFPAARVTASAAGRTVTKRASWPSALVSPRARYCSRARSPAPCRRG